MFAISVRPLLYYHKLLQVLIILVRRQHLVLSLLLCHGIIHKERPQLGDGEGHPNADGGRDCAQCIRPHQNFLFDRCLNTTLFQPSPKDEKVSEVIA